MTSRDDKPSAKSVPLAADVTDRLLGLLSESDEFREQFAADPISALESIGYAPDPSTAGSGLLAPFGGCQVSQLASKEAIASARNELIDLLAQGLAYTSPQLEATNFDRLFRK